MNGESAASLLMAICLLSVGCHAADGPAGVKPSLKEISISAADDAATWIFSPGGEFPGATGALKSADARESPAGISLNYDFSGGGVYVAAVHPLDLDETTWVSFEARQTGGNGGHVRITDSTGQTLQAKVALPAEQWSTVRVPLDSSTFTGHWGGANDGAFHLPINGIALCVNNDSTKQGSVSFRNLKAMTVPKPEPKHALLDSCEAITNWGFSPGGEYAGATGGIARTEEKGAPGFLRLSYDFTGGGRYVAATRPTRIGATRELSFFARQNGKNSGFVRVEDITGQTHVATIPLPADQWERVVVQLTPSVFTSHWGGSNDGGFHFPVTRIDVGVNSEGSQIGSLDIRDLSALTWDASQFFSVELQTPWPGNVAFKTSETPPVEVVVRNALDEQAAIRLQVAVEDWYGGTFAAPEQSVTLPPHGSFSRPISLDVSRPNYFQISPTILSVDGSPAVSFTKAVAVVNEPLNFGRDDPDSYFGVCMHQVENSRTERLGVKWVRAEMRDPEMLKKIRENHQRIMFLITDYGMPAKVPSLEDYEKVVRKVNPYVDVFEIQNEPNLTCMVQINLSFADGVDLYAEMLRRGADAVNKIAPGKPVAGIDTAGGDAGSLDFAEAILERDGHLVDVFTPHPYADTRLFGEGRIPQWPPASNERKNCVNIVALLKQRGEGQRFWVGEKGWALDATAEPLGVHSRQFAQCLAQSMALLKSVPGVEKYFWYVNEGGNESGYEYGLFRNGQPLPAAVAYATLAYQLDHAQPVLSPERLDPLQAHFFVSNATQTGVLVLWMDVEASFQLALSGLPEECVAYDLIGNPLPATSKPGSLNLTLDRAPVFLRFPAHSLDAVSAALAKAELTAENPIQIENAYVSDTSHVAARIRNVTSRAVTAEIKVGGERRALKFEPNERTIALLPAPVNLLGGSMTRIPVTVTVGDRSVSLDANADLVACRPAPSQLANGLLATGAGAPDFVLAQRAQILPADSGIPWNGPDDLSAQAWTAWDAQSLYVSIRAQDKVQFSSDAVLETFWNCDSLQIAIDPDNTTALGIGYAGKDVELGLVLGKDGPSVCLTAPKLHPLKIPIAVVRDEPNKVTTYQVAIPWTLLDVKPEAGHVLGFNFILNQNNGNGRVYWMGVTPGIGEAKNPWIYRKLSLVSKY